MLCFLRFWASQVGSEVVWVLWCGRQEGPWCPGHSDARSSRRLPPSEELVCRMVLARVALGSAQAGFSRRRLLQGPGLTLRRALMAAGRPQRVWHEDLLGCLVRVCWVFCFWEQIAVSWSSSGFLKSQPCVLLRLLRVGGRWKGGAVKGSGRLVSWHTVQLGNHLTSWLPLKTEPFKAGSSGHTHHRCLN